MKDSCEFLTGGSFTWGNQNAKFELWIPNIWWFNQEDQTDKPPKRITRKRKECYPRDVDKVSEIVDNVGYIGFHSLEKQFLFLSCRCRSRCSGASSTTNAFVHNNRMGIESALQWRQGDWKERELEMSGKKNVTPPNLKLN